MDLIYTPKGAAREYAELALNIFKGCQFGCQYCYGPGVMRTSRKNFSSGPMIKADFLERLEKDCRKLEGTDPPPVLISFVGDPYQLAPDPDLLNEPQEFWAARDAIKMLMKYEIPFTVLTKGGMAAARDFDLIKEADASFGTSLVWTDDTSRQFWEPNAASVKSRSRAIMTAKDMGITTWVSLEPVIDPDQALGVIDRMAMFVDHWKVGKINHLSHIEKLVDWGKFREDVIQKLDEVNADYYIKKSLSEI